MKFTRYPIFAILSLNLFCGNVSAQKEVTIEADKPKVPKTNSNKPKPGIREDSVTIEGKKIDYTVKAAELMLTNDKKEDKAKIFYVSYTVKNTDANKKRPILFAFNGGPGSSAVWLHL